MKKCTEIRCRKAVSTLTKSQAHILAACARRKLTAKRVLWRGPEIRRDHHVVCALARTKACQAYASSIRAESA
jgi:hypothetical protein